MIEDRARQHQAIRQRNRHANGQPSAEPTQHAAGRRSVKINVIADARKHGGNHVGLFLDAETHVAHKSLVQNFVNHFAIV